MHKYFGYYGGQYVPETLVPALAELEKEYETIKFDSEFQKELAEIGRASCRERV